MHARSLRKLRPWVQGASLLLFLVLIVGAGRLAILPADLFFRFDPLAGLAGMLAARHVVPALAVGTFVALALALLTGRAWCGWLCPLGTVLDLTPAHRMRLKEAELSPRWRQVKYYVLATVLMAALLGNLSLLVLDPITLLYRTVVTALWPALIGLVTAAEAALAGIAPLQDAVVVVDTVVRGPVLPMYQPVYALNVLAALLFAGVLAMNAVRSRFWCRYLCPLGGLLGMVSKVAILRRAVAPSCIQCARCAQACPTGTIEASRAYASDPAECVMCLDCLPACSKGGQLFRAHRAPAAWRSYDPSRRQFLASTGAAVATVGLLAAEPAATLTNPHLVRPPGVAGPGFLSQCIRCGVCVKVCPTSGLQPSLDAAGWAGVWSPVLTPRLGYCDYSCNACGQACPTGAIPALSLEQKRTTVIGHAYVDRSRCLPWASGRGCIVCEEMCPLPEKAIQLEEAVVAGPQGELVTVQRPVVIQDLCIGCGICENRCPLNGQPAIRIYAPTDLGLIG